MRPPCMKKLFAIVGSIVVSTLLGLVGARIGIMTGFLFGMVGTGLGMYGGVRLADRLGV